MPDSPNPQDPSAPRAGPAQPAEPTPGQVGARRYWDERAQSDPLYAIWGDPTVGHEGPPDADAFVRSGAEAARVLLPHIGPDSVVLEIGCGIGRILRAVAPHCREAIGLDVSQRMVEQAHAFLADVPNARVTQCDGATLCGIDDASVDLVYSLLCLIHADKRSAFRYLREIRRVLRPAGRAVLQFQDGTSARGHALFAGVAENDYPFEFYRPTSCAS